MTAQEELGDGGNNRKIDESFRCKGILQFSEPQEERGHGNLPQNEIRDGTRTVPTPLSLSGLIVHLGLLCD
jgi:hypothetical protein